MRVQRFLIEMNDVTVLLAIFLIISLMIVKRRLGLYSIIDAIRTRTISGKYLLLGLILTGIFVGYVGYRLFAPFEPEPTPTPTPIQLISFEESIEFALNGSYSMAGKWDFNEYRWLREYEGESFVTMDGSRVGYFVWRASNGTLFEAEYPGGEIHGKIERFTGVDDSNEYYVWKIILMDGAQAYIDARNGEFLSFSPSRFPGLLTFATASRIVHSPEMKIEEWIVQNYTRVGDFVSKPFKTADGLVKGHLLRRVSNGTLFEVWFPATQYPQGKVLHIEVPNDVEEYNVWEITTEENVFYIDARNGIIRHIIQ